MTGRRRLRPLMICAVIIVFMLYRVFQNSHVDSTGYSVLSMPRPYTAPKPAVGQDTTTEKQEVESKTKPKSNPVSWTGEEPIDKDTAPGVKDPETAVSDNTDKYNGESKLEVVKSPVGTVKQPSGAGKESTISGGQKYHGTGTAEEVKVDLKNPPNDETNKPILADSDVHWRPFPEQFPVPKESLAPLPTGKPKKIPKIQYQFSSESGHAEQLRTQRLEKVKEEIERSWGAYKKYAWMHDELSPVSTKYRDPFCGWAATLVDSLDTLWIAGLKTEFDEAAKAVANIDFTWTKRHDIPVFETTIRYLGGLLAAYDLSGGDEGSYPMLLEKAVELGDILMSTFDTPNRMPVLYFAWKPEFASQPRRSGIVGIAELGTLSMEFTRLAQLTGEIKYYDAINRITDALVQMQKDGTRLPGLFPQGINASGCNKTSATVNESISKAAEAQVDSEDLVEEPQGYLPEGLGSHRARPAKDDTTTSKHAKRGVSQPQSEEGSKSSEVRPKETPESSLSASDKTEDEIKVKKLSKNKGKGDAPLSAKGETSQWDCEPQPLVPSGHGFQSYHMGGAQDSAYEYFPKEYLLLGGLEPKYQKLYEDAVEAVNEWLLFRPMVFGDWDILFPARISSNGSPENDRMSVYEVTHLTCFIGGMYGLGGKIFGREKDIEIAKQLTDGCVWAYQAMPSGIMPEVSHVVPCPTMEKCDFNETMWWDHLDPSKDWREKEIARLEQQKTDKKQAALQQGSNKKAAAATQSKDNGVHHDDDGAHVLSSNHAKRAVMTEKDESSESLDAGSKPKLKGKGVKGEPIQFDGYPSVPRLSGPSRMSAKSGEKPLPHEEYVKQKIEAFSLPPSFTDILSREYILRPEAIESVWYMYRITGDPEWMEKGWQMFQAIIKATRTPFANSAIDDVTQSEPVLLDTMESFWIAETLKYYMLLFSKTDVISLDEWVLNTEAHPFRRPV